MDCHTNARVEQSRRPLVKRERHAFGRRLERNTIRSGASAPLAGEWSCPRQLALARQAIVAATISLTPRCRCRQLVIVAMVIVAIVIVVFAHPQETVPNAGGAGESVGAYDIAARIYPESTG